MSKAVFGRLLTAMVTPFTEQRQVDYDKTAELAKLLVKNGSEGLVVTGSTGEAPTLKEEEKLRMYSVVKETMDKSVKVIAGTGSNNTEASLELSIKAEKTGVDGIMLVVPYYNKPSQACLVEHFRVIAQGVPNLPIMLYNVPSRTGSNLEAETVLELAKVPNIVAIKEASGDLAQITKIIKDAPPEFDLYSGNDHETLSILSLGGKGVVSVASHIVGLKIRDMLTAFFAGKVEEAAIIHGELQPIFDAMFISSNPVPVKASLNLMGFPAGGHRLPLLKLDEAEHNYLKNVLQEHKII